MSNLKSQSKVFLIPSTLDESATHTIPSYVVEAVKSCEAFFVENERSARRFLKTIWKEMTIDNYKWVAIHKAEEKARNEFALLLKKDTNVGIISEAGCPGVADPGQLLIAVAQQHGATVVPLVGPNSILLALMASGLNGQHFQFVGYLPIDNAEKVKVLKQLESESVKKMCTQIFIETPYRNNQLIETILKVCSPHTKLCVAANITSEHETIVTKTIGEWKQQTPDLHKKPAVFLLLGIG